jgi:hypothetical protein
MLDTFLVVPLLTWLIQGAVVGAVTGPPGQLTGCLSTYVNSPQAVMNDEGGR